MKALLLVSFLFAGFQASAIILDDRDTSIRYDVRDVKVILACDAVRANVKNWYVLGSVNYSSPQLFFYSRGQLVLAKGQKNVTGHDSGPVYEINVGFLNYLFSKTSYNDHKLLITNANGQKVELMSCQDYLR